MGIGIFIIVLFVLVAIGMSFVTRATDRSRLDRWAADQNLDVEDVEKTWFDNGPYWMRGKRRIYRCKVRDAQGNVKTVYMRSGLFGNEVKQDE